MKKIITAILVMVLALVSFAADGMKYEIGKKVTGIVLKDLNGKDFDLEKTLAMEDVKGVVFIFVSEQCPVSRACDERYVEMAKKFGEKGIAMYGINSNTTESVKIMKGHAEKNNYNFRVLKDWNNIIADRFGALYTPHTYFVGKDATLLYKGRIDDNHRNAGNVKERTLANAVDTYLDGGKIEIAETISNGCEIKRVEAR
jgi:peroxiredoxin